MDTDKSNPDYEQFDLLVYAYFDNSLQPQQIPPFIHCMKTPEYVARFVEICRQDHMMREFLTSNQVIEIPSQSGSDGILPLEDSALDMQLWLTAARHEYSAPVVDLPKEKPPRELIQKVVYPPKTPRKFPTASVVTFLTTAAALLLAIAYVYLNPKQTPTQVATVLGTSRAIWGQQSHELVKGTRLLTCQPSMSLKQGLVEIEFDHGAKVMIEGPAEFSIHSDKAIYLSLGRLHTRVLDYGKGFTVQTPSSTLVDVGTEFGVEVNAWGDSQLHVLKGEVLLSPGANPKEEARPLRFKAGQAAQVSYNNFQVRTIAVQMDFRDSLQEPSAPPIFFEDFELVRPGELSKQALWQWVRDDSPVVVEGQLMGRQSLTGSANRSLQRGGSVCHALPMKYDLAVMTEPLYVSAIFEWDGRELLGLREEAVFLALNDVPEGNILKIEARFEPDYGTSIYYCSEDEGAVYLPSGKDEAEAQPFLPNRRYIGVMKVLPVSQNEAVISLGVFDVTDQSLSREASVNWQQTFKINPSQLKNPKTGLRYFLSHVTIGVSSTAMKADDLMVSDSWENIRQLTLGRSN